MVFGSSGCLNCSSCLEVGLALSWLSEQSSDLEMDCFVPAPPDFLLSIGVVLFWFFLGSPFSFWALESDCSFFWSSAN